MKEGRHAGQRNRPDRSDHRHASGESRHHTAPLESKRVRHLLVVQYGRLVGIISDRDVKSVLALSSGLEGLDHYRTAEQIMTGDPIAIAPTAPIEEAARLMMSARISALPMVQDTRRIGIVTETDLLRILSDVDPAHPALVLEKPS